MEIQTFAQFIRDNYGVMVTTRYTMDGDIITIYTSHTPKGRIIEFCTNEADVVEYLTHDFNQYKTIWELFLKEPMGTKIEDVLSDFNEWFYNWFTMRKEYINQSIERMI